jgi:iron(III) transport system permease protein
MCLPALWLAALLLPWHVQPDAGWWQHATWAAWPGEPAWPLVAALWPRGAPSAGDGSSPWGALPWLAPVALLVLVLALRELVAVPALMRSRGVAAAPRPPVRALFQQQTAIVLVLLLFVALLAQGLVVGPRGLLPAAAGWLQGSAGADAVDAARSWLADRGWRQGGLGAGACAAVLAALLTLAQAWAALPRRAPRPGQLRRPSLRGDPFALALALIGGVAVAAFVVWPLAGMLMAALRAGEGAEAHWSLPAFLTRLGSSELWHGTPGSLGVFGNTVLLALLAGVMSTALGFGLALAAERSALGRWKALQLLAVLPVVTPPFVVGLAVILLLGRNGAITQLVAGATGWAPTRYIYGWPGLLLAQTLAFTPVAFMMLRGTLQGIAPTLEQAAQTLRADRATVFRRVTLPLCAPGLANALLLGMVESMADFGNPALLGGQVEVLSTQIYFALVGASQDAGRAATLGLLLLACTGAVFALQTWLLAKASYTTIAGKGDGALVSPLPTGLGRGVMALTAGWLLLTLLVYGTVLVAGFVQQVGLDNRPTLSHLRDAFNAGFAANGGGWVWTGSAWQPLFTTLLGAGLAAPFTAAGGLALAWLVERRRFSGRRLLEATVLITFAVPGTVVGLAYIGAFNLPPLELTGTLGILIACFVFRDLPVAMRAGSAALAQIDASLEEAAATLRHSSWPALRRGLLPLLKPALVLALVVALVRAATSLSPVVFLATPEFTPVTVWVIERAESAQYGLAIVASAALVLCMGLAIALIQALVGERQIRRPVVGTAG